MVGVAATLLLHASLGCLAPVDRATPAPAANKAAGTTTAVAAPAPSLASAGALPSSPRTAPQPARSILQVAPPGDGRPPVLRDRVLQAPPSLGRRWAADAGLFVAGAASAFVAHELGHVFANLVAGNVPHLVGLRGFGAVPFFAISPDIFCDARGRCLGAQGQAFGGGRRGQYLIATAGFSVQHVANEVILGQSPDLRMRRAPYAKGWLAFDLALSVGYALASIAHVEDVHGDAGGAAYYARTPRAVVATMLLVPVALDVWRYFRPGDRWAPWVGRTSKLGLVGLSFAT